MFNLDTCQVVIWGFKNNYHTHSHIHEAFYRAFKHLGKQVLWFDQADELSGIEFSNTLFITDHEAAKIDGYWPWLKRKKYNLPLRDDCFYLIHGLNDDEVLKQQLINYNNKLSWNVFHDYSRTHGMSEYPRNKVGTPLDGQIWLAEDTPFYPAAKHMDFRWATDLLPDEIEKNKPSVVFHQHSKVIYWVGTVWHVNHAELNSFQKACEENDILFSPVGAGQHGVVSIEENIRLVKESYMAPAISGTHHLTEGYAPCRIFKNISYGQYGITNNRRVQDIFGGKLIYHSDPYKLFYEAKDRLKDITVQQLHELMDEVANKHTYLNRIECIIKAIKYLTE